MCYSKLVLEMVSIQNTFSIQDLSRLFIFSSVDLTSYFHLLITFSQKVKGKRTKRLQNYVS